MDEIEIIKAWKGQITEKTPLWLMRQAGRYLPEYRVLRAQAGGFLNMVYNPDLAAEITLQPLRRFDLDAGILFSDILVVPHALGLPLAFMEGEGPKLDTVENVSDLKKLKRDGFIERLVPVMDTVAKVRADMPQGKALIGFAGSPFTVASYMVHGQGGHNFAKIKAWAQNDAAGFGQLTDILVDTTVEYLLAQIKAGAQAIQLFESWAGALDGAAFRQWVIEPNARIARAVKKQYPAIPVIGFPRTDVASDVAQFATDTGVDAVGLSQDIDVRWARDTLQKSVCVQGNLAPELLLTGGQAMLDAAAEICENLGRGAFVFNLGHGVIKETNPDHVAQLVEFVHGYKRKAQAA